MRVPATKNQHSDFPEPRAGRASPLVRPIVFTALISFLLFATSASADPAQLVLTQAVAQENALAFHLQPLDDLLSLPDSIYSRRQASTDDVIVAAVTLGNDPDLEHRSNFRKHSLDLFRAQRWVTVGQRNLLVRLRIRAKTRNAMSIEVKF